MSIPEHLWRFPTREAIESLAKRFDLPNSPRMQDWEYEVADPKRLDEFLTAYRSGGLTEDERFTLMETILQSFDESPGDLSQDPRWDDLLLTLEQNVDLHIHTVWYWACVDGDHEESWFRITPHIRPILSRHRSRFESKATE